MQFYLDYKTLKNNKIESSIFWEVLLEINKLTSKNY